MLVLSRKIGERIRIGKDVEVMILGVQGATVRVGINAPRSVSIDREEVAEKKALERARK